MPEDHRTPDQDGDQRAEDDDLLEGAVPEGSVAFEQADEERAEPASMATIWPEKISPPAANTARVSGWARAPSGPKNSRAMPEVAKWRATATISRTRTGASAIGRKATR